MGGKSTKESVSGSGKCSEGNTTGDMMRVHFMSDGQGTRDCQHLALSRCSVDVCGMNAGQRRPSLYVLAGGSIG